MTTAIFKCSYESKRGLFVEEISVDLAKGVNRIPAEDMQHGEIVAKRRFKKHVLEQPNIPLKRITCKLDRYEASQSPQEMLEQYRATGRI